MKDMNNMKLKYFLSQLLLVFSVVVIILSSSSSCEKDPAGIQSEDSIYVMIDELMHSWYLWYDQVPRVDPLDYSTPSALLDVLMYKPLDKWSFVEKKEIIDSYFEEGVQFGFGFYIRFDESSNLRVIIVYEDSEAFRQGIRKGDIIKSINGTPAGQINDFTAFFSSEPATYTFEVTGSDLTTRTIQLSKEDVNLNGVLYRNIYQVSGEKTGYVVYDSFLGYTEEEVDEAFTYFKSNNITELIIDLRYNSGGYIHLTEKIAEMVLPVSANGRPLYSYIHNNLVGPMYDTTVYCSINSELTLNLDRVFFITTDISASASELLINSLEPHMDVYLIGSPTYGKPVGMYGFLVQDWYIYPVTTQLINADGFGDFYNGLPVDKATSEGLGFDWGDENDPHLIQAFSYISDGAFLPDKEFIEPKGAMDNNNINRYMNRRNLLILDR